MNTENNSRPPRSARVEARVTPDEFRQIAALADKCGLSVSDYVRRCSLNMRPRQRLTERQAEALCSLADARGDLVRIAAAVRSIRADKRGLYFRNTAFVERWMQASLPLIERWRYIQENFTNDSADRQ